MPVCVSDIDLNGLSKVAVTAQNSGALCEYRTVDAVLSFSASAQAFPLMQSDLEIREDSYDWARTKSSG